MSKQHIYRSGWAIVTLMFMVTGVGCGVIPSTVTVNQPTASALPSASPVPSPASVETTPTTAPVSGANVLYQDDFTDPVTGWPEDKFDNYFIGYHEPEYYHIEITSPNYKSTVFEPKKQSFGDVTLELQVLTVSKKTAETGDFRYGLAFRRSGDQYYAFTISPRTKKWYVLKNSPNALTVLAEGTEDSIHDLDTDDALRVDAQGANFFFHINDHLVGQVTDAEYAKGEVGFYVETLDATNAHIHFDTLVIRNFEAPPPQEEAAAMLYQDDFTNPSTGWPEKKFDNYFIGYHEPEYYHVEITSPNYKTTVFEPEKKSFGDATIELQVFTVSKKTAATGDFRYGLAFRRSGDQYYAFTISPRTKKWYVLKSSPNELVVLAEGTEDSIHDLDTADTLRVDAQGSNFLFHINDKLVSQVTDADYPEGEVGFYAETFDATNIHIHFDELTIREVELSLTCHVDAMTLYVRSGPGKKFPSLTVLSNGETIEPLGLSPDKQWIKIKMAGSPDPGWVFNSEGFLSCNAPVKLLPVVNP
ncbi:MAG TPA: SH3 domain-containing protein [Anaerolineales bacterium]